MSDSNGKWWDGTFEMVDPAAIVFDHTYQRPDHLGLQAHIAANPVPAAFGVPVCFKRPNGVFYGVDGQQRVKGLLQAESPPRLIPVVWFPTPAGIESEAEIFVLINEFRKQLTALEKHKGKVVALDPAAVAIARAVDAVGFSIGKSTSSRSVGAVGALNYTYNLLGEWGISQLLVGVRDAWPDDKGALETKLLHVLADVIEEHKNSKAGFNRQKFSRALALTTTGAIKRRAEDIHHERGKGRRESLRSAIAELTKL